MHELADNMAYDYVSEKQVAVERVDLFAAGFACKGWSTLNGSRDELGTVIAGSKGASGESARGCLKAIEKLRPAVIIFENVKQIDTKAPASGVDEMKKSDLDYLKTELARMNYRLATFRIKAEAYGSPSNRDRLYFVGTRDIADELPDSPLAAKVASLPLGQAAVDIPAPRWAAEMQHMLNVMVKSPQYPVTEFLFGCAHPEVVRCLRERTTPVPKAQAAPKANVAGKAQAAPKAKDSSGAAAEKEVQGCDVKNYQYFMEANLNWPLDPTANPELAKALAYLPERPGVCQSY